MNPNPFISADQEPAPAQPDSLASNNTSAVVPEVQSQPANQPQLSTEPAVQPQPAAQPTTQFQPASAPISDDELAAANQNIQTVFDAFSSRVVGQENLRTALMVKLDDWRAYSTGKRTRTCQDDSRADASRQRARLFQAHSMHAGLATKRHHRYADLRL